MPSLTIEKTYEDGVTPTSADFDNICDSLEIFLNITKLGSDNIMDNSITASSTLVAASVTSDKIQNLAVTTAKILNDAVTADKIATSAVTTVKILDANVTTAKIADSAITDAKVAVGAVTSAKKASNSSISGSGTATSSGSITYTSTSSVTGLRRPALFNMGGGYLAIYSASSGTIMEGSCVLQKDGVTAMNQEIKAGPFYYGAGYQTTLTLPSSSIFYIDTTTYDTSTTVGFRIGVDLTAGTSMTASGGRNILEII